MLCDHLLPNHVEQCQTYLSAVMSDLRLSDSTQDMDQRWSAKVY